jgi:hypothetical protein
MTRGMEKGEPHLSQAGGGQAGEIVSRRRGRPPRQARVAVAYRPLDPEEELDCNDALRLLLASMVRSRLGGQEEAET